MAVPRVDLSQTDLLDDAEDTFGLIRSPASHRKKTTKASCFHAAQEGQIDNRVYLAGHRGTREKNADVKNLISVGIRQNRFCKLLDDEDLDAIINTMEYFTFSAGEPVVRQGHVGYYFFVVQDGQFDVFLNDSFQNVLGSGVAFGAIALLYACPRTATVTAKVDSSSVWGVDAVTFRQVLLANAQKHHVENRRFLDSINLFDGLGEDQKERIEKLAVFVECFPAGARVVSEGELPTAMYFVKKGELSMHEGSTFDNSGQLVGGAKIAQLKVGDRFGERAVLYSENRCSTVVAETECELLCIGAQQLREILGEDIKSCLERSFILSMLTKLPLISHLSMTQQQEIVQAMTIKFCAPGESVQGQEQIKLTIVIDGEIAGDVDDSRLTIRRGQWCGDAAFAKAEAILAQGEGPEAGCTRLRSMVAGPNGARIATLTTQSLVDSLKTLGLSAIGGSDEALEYMRQVLCAKKVPIFRGLSPDQITSFVNSFVLKRYSKGAYVIKQGEVGTHFYIISRGSVNIVVDGRVVRVLGTNSCFGERALLFDEPRSASCEVTEDDTELWSISKNVFNDVISENMRRELEYRSKLQDTTVHMKLIVHVRLIGAGSFGSVRLVEHKYTRLRYALKRIKKVNGEVPAAVRSECALLSEIDHPFILHLVKTFDTASSCYILTELITGGQLHEQMGKMGVLNRKQAQFYVGSLVLILEYLHGKGIVYRDLKPENVMLDMQGYLQLVDFGLAKKLVEGKTYTLAGTLLYMAPEVFLGHGYAISVDLWSLGVMFFEFVCGCMPFGDEHPDDDSLIIDSILNEEWTCPSSYNDSAGKKLMQGLLIREPATRLGAGLNGFDEIKQNKYFKQGVSGDLFSKIIGRELDPPVAPEEEHFSDARYLEETITLSDEGELGSDG